MKATVRDRLHVSTDNKIVKQQAKIWTTPFFFFFLLPQELDKSESANILMTGCHLFLHYYYFFVLHLVWI